MQVDTRLWQVPFKADVPDAPDYINHSCAANCGMADSTQVRQGTNQPHSEPFSLAALNRIRLPPPPPLQVIAIRDIPAGAEVTLDYATINDGASRWASDNFACGCGAAGCRGAVTSRDWEVKSVQDRYWPHFSPFVRRLVAARRPDLAAPPTRGKAVAAPAAVEVAVAARAGGIGSPIAAN
jgi:hypothetical protein